VVNPGVAFKFILNVLPLTEVLPIAPDFSNWSVLEMVTVVAGLVIIAWSFELGTFGVENVPVLAKTLVNAFTERFHNLLLLIAKVFKGLIVNPF
jgi:hypothetical protein